jgi:hypothetical protein
MSGFKKFDGNKLDWSLLPIDAVEKVLYVWADGAVKYGKMNWVDNAAEVQWTRYMNAFDRHWADFKRGRDFDKDSGRLELAHAAANILMLLQYQANGLGIDDRWKSKTPGESVTALERNVVTGQLEEPTYELSTASNKIGRSYAP